MIVDYLLIWTPANVKLFSVLFLKHAQKRIFNIYVLSMKMPFLSFQSLMSDTEYEEIVTNNIILELNDDSPESKLLGIQIDIDLEDKNKSSDDIN